MGSSRGTQCSAAILNWDTRLWLTVHSCEFVVKIKRFSNNKLDGWLQMSASQMMRLSLFNSFAPPPAGQLAAGLQYSDQTIRNRRKKLSRESSLFVERVLILLNTFTLKKIKYKNCCLPRMARSVTGAGQLWTRRPLLGETTELFV